MTSTQWSDAEPLETCGKRGHTTSSNATNISHANTILNKTVETLGQIFTNFRTTAHGFHTTPPPPSISLLPVLSRGGGGEVAFESVLFSAPCPRVSQDLTIHLSKIHRTKMKIYGKLKVA